MPSHCLLTFDLVGIAQLFCFIFKHKWWCANTLFHNLSLTHSPPFPSPIHIHSGSQRARRELRRKPLTPCPARSGMMSRPPRTSKRFVVVVVCGCGCGCEVVFSHADSYTDLFPYPSTNNNSNPHTLIITHAHTLSLIPFSNTNGYILSPPV